MTAPAHEMREACAELAVRLAEHAANSRIEFSAKYYSHLFLAGYDGLAAAAPTIQIAPAATVIPALTEAESEEAQVAALVAEILSA